MPYFERRCCKNVINKIIVAQDDNDDDDEDDHDDEDDYDDHEIEKDNEQKEEEETPKYDEETQKLVDGKYDIQYSTLGLLTY